MAVVAAFPFAFFYLFGEFLGSLSILAEVLVAQEMTPHLAVEELLPLALSAISSLHLAVEISAIGSCIFAT